MVSGRSPLPLPPPPPLLPPGKTGKGEREREGKKGGPIIFSFSVYRLYIHFLMLYSVMQSDREQFLRRCRLRQGISR